MDNVKMKYKRILQFLMGFMMIMLLVTGLAGCKKKEQASTEGLSIVTTETVTEAEEETRTEESSEEKTESQSEEKSEEETRTEESSEEKTESQSEEEYEEKTEAEIDENGYYYSKDEVALYIHIYGRLPGNFITKKEAKKLGWEGGSLEDYAPGKVIGGDRFGNREGVLPDYGEYHECDIDTLGKKKRGAKRIVYSDDGRIYYTDDHYETFELLYGEER